MFKVSLIFASACLVFVACPAFKGVPVNGNTPATLAYDFGNVPPTSTAPKLIPFFSASLSSAVVASSFTPDILLSNALESRIGWKIAAPILHIASVLPAPIIRVRTSWPPTMSSGLSSSAAIKLVTLSNVAPPAIVPRTEPPTTPNGPAGAPNTPPPMPPIASKVPRENAASPTFSRNDSDSCKGSTVESGPPVSTIVGAGCISSAVGATAASGAAAEAAGCSTTKPSGNA